MLRAQSGDSATIKYDIFLFDWIIHRFIRVKRPGAIATEEPYPLGIGQRSKKELFRQVKLQEIEEQNESFDKTKENEAQEGIRLKK